MQHTNRDTSSIGSSTEMVSFSSGPWIATKQAIAGSTRGRNSFGRYHRSLSKQKIKVSRYTESGSTQTRGMGAMFCVSRFVTLSSRAEVQADRPSQRAGDTCADPAVAGADREV